MLCSNFQKIIILSSVILVSSAVIGYIVSAWDEPGDVPPNILPADNIYELINISSDSQTKAGDLTVSALTVSDGHLYLNADGNKGDIERADYIKGHNDLHLLSDTGAPTAASIYLDKEEEEIEFYTQGTERMKIDGAGDVHISGFNDCFLMANNDGKLMCYSGGAMPIGEEFQSDNTEEILHIGKSGSDSLTLIEGEEVIVDGEGVIKVTANVSARCRGYWESFKLYINGEEKEQLTAHGYSVCTFWAFSSCMRWECKTETKSGTWYYHVKQGDVVEITTSGSGSYCSGSASVYNLTFRRETIDYVSSDGIILYYYDINSTGKMGKVFQRFEPTVPVSMAVTADGIPIKIVVQE
ncbi:hypothetical protein KAW43_01685 [Candidatus Parcubacteria bacterium]|nr:hypothetical protein [Candidatus Parcubacteria bacterium]